MAEGKRIVRHYSTSLPARPEQVFPLLCPVREYDWIPYWRCNMIYSRSGVAELGCVFTTDFQDRFGQETWVVSHYEPNSKIAFVKTGLIRSTRYEVTLLPQEDGTGISWYQELTGLTAEGEEIVASFSRQEYETLMVSLNKMLAHYLTAGESLAIDMHK